MSAYRMAVRSAIGHRASDAHVKACHYLWYKLLSIKYTLYLEKVSRAGSSDCYRKVASSSSWSVEHSKRGALATCTTNSLPPALYVRASGAQAPTMLTLSPRSSYKEKAAGQMIRGRAQNQIVSHEAPADPGGLLWIDFEGRGASGRRATGEVRVSVVCGKYTCGATAVDAAISKIGPRR